MNLHRTGSAELAQETDDVAVVVWGGLDDQVAVEFAKAGDFAAVGCPVGLLADGVLNEGRDLFDQFIAGGLLTLGISIIEEGRSGLCTTG